MQLNRTIRGLRFFLVLLVLLGSTSVRAGVYDYHKRYLTLQTDHFAIHFAEENEVIARKVARITEEVYGAMTKKFDRHPWGRTEVVLTDGFDSSNAFATVIPYNMLTIRLVAPAPDNNLGDYDHWLKEVITHEYTHIMHISDTGYPAKAVKLLIGKLMAPNGTSPGWIREGLAAYFETEQTTRGRGRSSFTDMMLRTDILRGKFLKLDQMAGTQYDWPGWLAQYLYGVGFMQYLAETYGEDKLIEFSHSYGSSLRFYTLNSHAKKVFHGSQDPAERKDKCEEAHWVGAGNWQVQRTYPEFCGPQGKTFYDLWAEWKESLERKYGQEKAQIASSGLQEGEVVVGAQPHESNKHPVYSPDGTKMAYVVETVAGPPRLVLRDLETGKEQVLTKKRKEISQISFSPDGGLLVFSAVGPVSLYRSSADLFLIALKDGKVRRLTVGKRARDPSFSPDGKKIVFVKQGTGASWLAYYDLEKKQVEDENPNEDQLSEQEFNHPQWSPDGRWIAVSIHQNGGRDLWLVNPKGGQKTRVTNDVAVEDRPTWDLSGKSLYYSSDKTGVANIYRYPLGSHQSSAVTNVLTGAYDPSIGKGGQLAFQYYTGDGFEIRQLSGRSAQARAPMVLDKTKPKESVAALAKEEAAVPDPGPYRAFRRLLVPRFVYPNGAFVDGSLFLSGQVTNFDPLQWHVWSAMGNFRTDNNFFGYGFSYVYQRFLPIFFGGYNVAAVNYGDLYGVGINYFENRKRSYGGIGFPFLRGRAQAMYFFEDRSSESGIPAGAITFPTTGHYAGFHTQFNYGRLETYPASIGTERGFNLGLNVDVTNSVFGSSNQQEQSLFYGDMRGYIPLGHSQVVALRTAGGVSFGDRLTQGNYSLGGSLGEGPFTQTSTRLFTVRGIPIGTFSRDDVWMASMEYRFPLLRVQRGLGTLPFFLKEGHFALFADVGDGFNRNQTPSKFRPMLSVGGELRGDFVLGYGIPVTGRLGYGIVLTNRARLNGVQDSFTSASAKKGVVVFELGSSF